MELFEETFGIHQFINESAETVLPLVEKNGNRLVINCAEDIGEMKADLTKVRQMLFNLLSNASKFTHQGTVTLAADRDDDNSSIVFSIRDTGIGMTEEQQHNIFEEFGQAEASTTRDYGGTGLGLTISKRFCELMGGILTVESEQNKGSVFTVILPVNMTEKN